VPHTVPSRPKRILLIDDNVDLAQSLSIVFEMVGHSIQIAFDGCSGVEKARRFCPEVVVCDLELPGMDGFAVARLLRQEECLEATRLIALSAHDVREQALAAGFDHFLQKPGDLRELAKLIAR
jgi:two-component system CheB/CheR fusion protein